MLLCSGILNYLIQVYGGEARISTLRKLFPRIEDKRSLATADERKKVEGKASLLAAVDYYVSMHSDIFISASPGNMHNAMVSNLSIVLLILIVISSINKLPYPCEIFHSAFILDTDVNMLYYSWDIEHIRI